MKGVILAGGTGSRMAPLTNVLNKHLLPVYDKPMIFYPLECLARSGVGDVLVVTGGHSVGDMVRLLGDGRQFGLDSLQFVFQDGAGGIAQALGLAEAFAAGDRIVLVLGDNILERTIEGSIQAYAEQPSGARVLLSEVDTPQSFGIAEIKDGRIVQILEKPAAPPSNLAVIGIYLYDQQVFDIIRGLTPSQRRELEITDVNNTYLQKGQLAYDLVEGWWADAGETIDGYLDICNRVARTGANHCSSS